MCSLIDLHHHLLVGVDDGPSQPQTMERMVAIAWQQGVRTLIATPHIAPGVVPFSPEILAQRLEEVKQAIAAQGYFLRLHAGCEMLYTHQAARYVAQGRIPTLAGSNKLLVEFPTAVRFDEIDEAIRTLLHCGLIPVLAHIERYACLMLQPRRCAALKEKYEVLYQINCDAILGRLSPLRGRTVARLLQEGQIDYVASDAHGCEQRPCRMQAAYARLVALVGASGADTLTGNRTTLDHFLAS